MTVQCIFKQFEEKKILILENLVIFGDIVVVGSYFLWYDYIKVGLK